MNIRFCLKVCGKISSLEEEKMQMLDYTRRKVTLKYNHFKNPFAASCLTAFVLSPFASFFCSSHLKFNSLTLISTHGLPGKKLLGSEPRKFLASEYELCLHFCSAAQMSCFVCSLLRLSERFQIRKGRCGKFALPDFNKSA